MIDIDWKIVDEGKKPKHLCLWVAIFGFLGYAFGRVGHLLWGSVNTIHHWITALLIMAISPLFRKKWYWVLILSFGIGFLISDLDDFIHLRVWGVDVNDSFKFWGVD